MATAQDSMTRGEDKLVVRGEIKGQFTAPAESLTIESDADTLGILSGIVTVADDFETSGGGVTQATNDVADDDCYFNQTYYEEWDSNDILMTGDAFADSSSVILKVNIPADYASSDSVTLRLPDVGQGGEMPRINLYIEDKVTPTAITTAATYNLALGDSGSTHILLVYPDLSVSIGDTLYIDIKTLIDEAISDGAAAGGASNICIKVIDTDTGQYTFWDALEASDKPAYVKWNYTASGGGADSLYAAALAGAEQSPQNVFADGTPLTVIKQADAALSTCDAVGECWIPTDGDSVYIYKAANSALATVTIDGLDFLIKDNAKEMTINNIVLKHAKYGVEVSDANTLVYNGVGDTLQYDLRSTVAGVVLENWISLNPYIASLDAADKTNGFSHNYNAANKYLVGADDSTLTDTDENAVTSGIVINAATYVQGNGSTTIDGGTGDRDGKAKGDARDIGWDENTANLSVTLTSFTGGGVYYIGESYPITWTHEGCTTLSLAYSDDNGDSWNVIDPVVAAADLTYTWDLAGCDLGSDYIIRINNFNDPGTEDESGSTFSISLDPAFATKSRFDVREPFDNLGRWNR
jgi:hypothetical protein